MVDNIITPNVLLTLSLRFLTVNLVIIIIKLDLDNDFDRLEWDLIEHVLDFFNFPTPFISMIMKCITSSKFNILINGKPTETIYPSRGLR